MKKVFITTPTTKIGAHVMVTNVVGNQILSYQYAVYIYWLPDNTVLQWQGIYNSVSLATKIAMNIARTVDATAVDVLPDGKW